MFPSIRVNSIMLACSLKFQNMLTSLNCTLFFFDTQCTSVVALDQTLYLQRLRVKARQYCRYSSSSNRFLNQP